MVPIALGAILLVSAMAKPLTAPACGDNPFETASGIMFVVEMVCGIMLLHRRMGRRVAALFWAMLMPGAALYLAYMHHRGFDVRSCHCFGPVKLDFATHLGVIGAFCAIGMIIFLREETRELDGRHSPETGDARALARPTDHFR